MYCFSVGKRNLENLFNENIVCRMCFELESFNIGLTKHFIVHEENLVKVANFLYLGDFVIAYSLDFEVLEVVSEFGSMIICGNNYINCQDRLPLD